MLELTEDTVADFIKDGTVVIKVWDDNCPYCSEYAPIFDAGWASYLAAKDDCDCKHDEHACDDKLCIKKAAALKIPRGTPSAFRRAYMKTDKGGEKNSVPATFIFENGELKHTAWGRLMPEQLAVFLKTGEVPAAKPLTIEEWIKKASVIELKAAVYDEMERMQAVQNNINALNGEILARKKT